VNDSYLEFIRISMGWQSHLCIDWSPTFCEVVEVTFLKIEREVSWEEKNWWERLASVKPLNSGFGKSNSNHSSIQWRVSYSDIFFAASNPWKFLLHFLKELTALQSTSDFSLASWTTRLRFHKENTITFCSQFYFVWMECFLVACDFREFQ
jgi:hypothetical protein